MLMSVQVQKGCASLELGLSEHMHCLYEQFKKGEVEVNLIVYIYTREEREVWGWP